MHYLLKEKNLSILRPPQSHIAVKKSPLELFSVPPA